MKLPFLSLALCLIAADQLNAWELSNSTKPKYLDGVVQIEPGDYEILALAVFPEKGIVSFAVYLPREGDVLVSLSESQSFMLSLDHKNVVHLLSSQNTGDFQEAASWSEDGDRWVHVTIDTTHKYGLISVESEWVEEMEFAETLVITGSDVFYLTDLAAEQLDEHVAVSSSEILEQNLDVSEMIWRRGKASIDFTAGDTEGTMRPPLVLDPRRQPGGRFTMLIERPIKRKAILSTPASASFSLPEGK